jgi:hypothetical protein
LLLDAGGTLAPVVKHFQIGQKVTQLASSLGLVAHFKRVRGEGVPEFSWAKQYVYTAFAGHKTVVDLHAPSAD